MGLSISASAAIIFVASVIVFSSVLGAMDKAEQSIINAQQASMDRQGDALLTHITITGVDRDNRTISVLNDGSVTLSLSDVDIMLDGVLSNDRIVSESVQGVDDTDIWLPDEVLILQMNGDLDGAAIMVVVGDGITAYD
jgi:flagellar protein FlaF